MGYAGKIGIGEQTHLIGSALYGTCETPAATTEKVVTLGDFDTLIDGITIKVKFLNTNTAVNPTLNVNGTGALPIYRHGVVPPGTSAYNTWAANAVLSFTYDGTAWRMEEPFDITQLQQALLNVAYPVGSIYMSVNSTNPSSLFGGTWVQLKDRFLLGAGDTYSAGATAGAAEVALEVGNLPSHNHSVGSHTHPIGSHTHTLAAHSHGLNSHTHSMSHTHSLNGHTHAISGLTGTAASAGSHSHEEHAGVVSVTKGYVPHAATGVAGVTYTSGGESIFHTVYDNKQNSWEVEGGYMTSSGGAHTHSVTSNGVTGASTGSTAGSSADSTGAASENTASSGELTTRQAASGSITGSSTGFNTGNTGSGTAHNNMPPYLAVYIWKRTA